MSRRSQTWQELFDRNKPKRAPTVRRAVAQQQVRTPAGRRTVTRAVTQRAPAAPRRASVRAAPVAAAAPLDAAPSPLGAAPAVMPPLSPSPAFGTLESVSTTTTAVGTDTGWFSRNNILIGIGFVLLVVLIGLVAFLLFKWFMGKREQHAANNNAENDAIRTAAFQQGVAQGAQQAAAAKPAVSQYGPEFAAGTNTCQDTDSRCAGWAANNECLINPSYALYRCRSSCNTCGLDVATLDKIRDKNLSICQDFGPDCANADCSSWDSQLRCRKTCASNGCASRMDQ